MLPKVAVGLHCCAPSTNVENYRALVGDDLVEEIQQFNRDLKDVRVCRVNATASGGGAAELLAAGFTAKRSGCAAGAFNTAGCTEAVRATTARSTGVAAGRAASTATCGRRWVSTGVWGRGTCLVARSMAQVIWVGEGNGNSCLLREIRST